MSRSNSQVVVPEATLSTDSAILLQSWAADGDALAARVLSRSVELANHPVYKDIGTLERTRVFMRYHIWCVWDFMSLAKAVQTGLGCFSIPWIPPEHPDLTRAIGEILEGEEADLGPDGQYGSHFDIYRKAMIAAGAGTDEIDRFIDLLRSGKPVDSALESCRAPDATRAFVRVTMGIATAPLHSAVAAFCLSREELVPAMFEPLLQNLAQDSHLAFFKWYVQRHIDLDTDSHGPLSAKLLRRLLDSAHTRQEALQASLNALDARYTYLDATRSEVLET